MNRLALVTSLLAVFLVGVSLGLIGGIVFSQGRPFGAHGPVAGMRMLRGPRGPAQALPRLARALDLTPEQVRRLEPRVRASQRLFEAARESLRARIEIELTPEQRARWRELERGRGFPGGPRGRTGRPHRAEPGSEGEPR